MIRHSSFIIRHLLALLLALGSARAFGASLSDHLPYDTLGFVEIDPQPLFAAEERNGSGELFDLSVQAMSSLGMMPRHLGAVSNLLRLGGQMGRRHHVMAWLDADFVVDYNTGQLTTQTVQVAWIVDVGGQPDAMLVGLAAVLSDCSTPQTSRQSVQGRGVNRYVEFYDTRWPAWLHLYWMMQGNNLVVTAGAGSMEHYLTHTARHNPWEDTLAQCDRQCAKEGADGTRVLRAWASIRQMRERWPDVVTMTMASRLLQAFDWRYADQVLLTGAVTQRALALHYATLGENKTLTLVPLTVDLPAGAPLRKLVPADATFYAVFNMDWHALYVRLVNVLDIAAEKRTDEGIKEAVQEFSGLHGVNVQKDIVAALEPLVLVHNAPVHPLRLPGLVSVIAAARPAGAPRLKFAVDLLAGEASLALDHRARLGDDPWDSSGSAEAGGAAAAAQWTHLRIRRDRAGVTYLQFGLVGPAWTWVDRRLVYSWSPTAVRQLADQVRAQGAGADCFAVPGK